jgi:hypothetical protein
MMLRFLRVWVGGLKQVSFQLKMHFVLYSKEGAESLCSTVLADICPFPVTFLEKGYLLLSSPIVEQVCAVQ